MIQDVTITMFHCDVYSADIRVDTCKQRRENAMLSKLRYTMDPYERCGTCSQALNVDAGEIETFTKSFSIDNSSYVPQDKTSKTFMPPVPRATIRKRRPPIKIIQSPAARKKAQK